MTAPLPDDPFEGVQVATPTGSRRARDLLGLVLVVIGGVVLFVVAGLVDARLGWALVGAVCVAGGFALGHGDERG